MEMTFKNSGILSRGNDIIAIENEVNSLKAKADDTLNALNLAKNDLAEVEADITAIKADILTLNEDKIRTVAELKRIDDLRQSVKLSLKELKDAGKIAAIIEKYIPSEAK